VDIEQIRNEKAKGGPKIAIGVEAPEPQKQKNNKERN
jgi:hypothetical protein